MSVQSPVKPPQLLCSRLFVFKSPDNWSSSWICAWMTPPCLAEQEQNKSPPTWMNFWQISPNKILLLSVASSPSEAALWCIFKYSGVSSTSSSYLQVRVPSRSSANPTSLKVWFDCCQAVQDPVKTALLSSRCLKTACFVRPAVHKAERPERCHRQYN